jgi:methionine aminopeptidase
LDAAARVIKPGVTTDNIDEVVHQATISAGAYPSPLNYHFIPKPCCTFVHEVICHGIPDARQLEEGDIVNVDVTVCLNGCHAELNETYILAKWMKHQKLWFELPTKAWRRPLSFQNLLCVTMKSGKPSLLFSFLNLEVEL